MDRAEKRRMKREVGVPPKPQGKVLVAETVIAKQFTLVDKAGHPRGGMMVTPEGMASLILHDKTGRITSGLLVSEDGTGHFYMTNGEGWAGIALRIGKEAPSVILSDKEGVLRLGLSLSGTGSPTISLQDKSGKQRLILMVDKENEPDGDDLPVVMLHDKDGKTRAGLALPSE